jgi:hypothetical protein
MKRNYWFLLLSIITFTALGFVVYFFPPNYTVTSLQISIVYAFYTLIFLSLFSAGSFIFKSHVHGILLGLVVVAYLLFRQNDLTHPFFALLLAALFLVLELLFSYKK